jgi:hypothetical protein
LLADLIEDTSVVEVVAAYLHRWQPTATASSSAVRAPQAGIGPQKFADIGPTSWAYWL